MVTTETINEAGDFLEALPALCVLCLFSTPNRVSSAPRPVGWLVPWGWSTVHLLAASGGETPVES